jgi:hypothetical protein
VTNYQSLISTDLRSVLVAADAPGRQGGVALRLRHGRRCRWCAFGLPGRSAQRL